VSFNLWDSNDGNDAKPGPEDTLIGVKIHINASAITATPVN